MAKKFTEARGDGFNSNISSVQHSIFAQSRGQKQVNFRDYTNKAKRRTSSFQVLQSKTHVADASMHHPLCLISIRKPHEVSAS